MNEEQKLNVNLTSDEIKLFKDDPETFREYLRYRSKQIDRQADITLKELDIEKMKIEKHYEEKDKNRLENDKIRDAEEKAREERNRNWLLVLGGVGAICDFISEKKLNEISH